MLPLLPGLPQGSIITDCVRRESLTGTCIPAPRRQLGVLGLMAASGSVALVACWLSWIIACATSAVPTGQPDECSPFFLLVPL